MTAKEQIGGKIFEFILDMAFNDATMRSAFNNPYKKPGNNATKEEQDDFRELKNSLKESVACPIKKYLKCIIDGGATENTVYEYIQEVLENAKGICDAYREKTYNKDFDFTFGHAQKVVNMAAKYLYIAHYADQSIRDNFKICHCPMDSIMIKGVIKEVERLNEEGLKIEKLKNDTPWSKIGTNKYSADIYKEFQDVVKKLSEREELIPLEYDYNHWAEFAEDM